MVCLDTDIFVSLLRGDKEAIEFVSKLEKANQPIRTTIITVYELLKGAGASSMPERNLARVRDLISSARVLGLSYGACEEASRVYAGMKRKGKTMSEFDLLIAAIGMYNDDILISRDEHFKLVEGLTLRTW